MSDQSTEGPADPFAEETSKFPEELGDEQAQERIHEFLQRYQSGEELLTGWVLLTSWASTEPGTSALAYDVMPGQDWFRTLGILDAGVERLHAEFNDGDDEDP